jgi:hypothetical protein
MQVRRIKFVELKNAYLIVKKHIAKTCNKDVNSTKLRIAQDLCLHGDDNYELLAEMAREYKIDFKGFDYDEHFVNEAHVYNPYAALSAVILFPVLVVKVVVGLVLRPVAPALSKKISSYRLRSIDNYKKPELTDLTVGDLIATLIERKFTLRKNIKYIVE